MQKTLTQLKISCSQSITVLSPHSAMCSPIASALFPEALPSNLYDEPSDLLGSTLQLDVTGNPVATACIPAKNHQLRGLAYAKSHRRMPAPQGLGSRSSYTHVSGVAAAMEHSGETRHSHLSFNAREVVADQWTGTVPALRHDPTVATLSAHPTPMPCGIRSICVPRAVSLDRGRSEMMESQVGSGKPRYYVPMLVCTCVEMG